LGIRVGASKRHVKVGRMKVVPEPFADKEDLDFSLADTFA
jgi:hypothetical protein